MGRKRSMDMGGQPFLNYHTMSNNAIFGSNPNQKPTPPIHTELSKHKHFSQRANTLLPTIRPSHNQLTLKQPQLSHDTTHPSMMH